MREVPGKAHAIWMGDTGAVVDQIERFVTGQEPTAGTDHALVTMLFTDIVDSTVLAREQGDAWGERLEEHNSRLGRTVESFGGRVVKWTGDGAFATLPGPVSAIRAAAAIGRAVDDLGIAVRAGVHVGEVERLADGDLAGVQVHHAARVMGEAGAGEMSERHRSGRGTLRA